MNGIFIAYEAGARRILVQTDLLILVHTNGATKNEALSRNFREGRKRYFKDAIIEWRHVKGHNLSKVNDRRTYVNDWCDKRAKIQMRKQRGDIDSARQQSQVR